MKSTILLLTKSTDSRVLRKSASLREVNYKMALQNAKEKKSLKGTTVLVNRNIDVMQKLWDTVSLLVFKQSWRGYFACRIQNTFIHWYVKHTVMK